MLESKLDDLAMDLESALAPRKAGPCGCNELSPLTGGPGGDAIALPATMPPLQTLTAEIQSALTAAGQSAPDELVDEMGEPPVTLDNLLELLRQNPGLKLHLSF
jgi:hypothetical protein